MNGQRKTPEISNWCLTFRSSVLCWSYICLYCTATYSFIFMFPMILHHRLNFLLFRELVMIMLPSFVRICVGSLTWNACLHVFSLAGNLVYYIWYINRYTMQQTGLPCFLVASKHFFVFTFRILCYFSTLGSFKSFSLSNLNGSCYTFSAVMETREAHQSFSMKMHQRDCFNSLLLLFVVASRCSMHVLRLVHWYAQKILWILN